MKTPGDNNSRAQAHQEDERRRRNVERIKGKMYWKERSNKKTRCGRNSMITWPRGTLRRGERALGARKSDK